MGVCIWFGILKSIVNFIPFLLRNSEQKMHQGWSTLETKASETRTWKKKRRETNWRPKVSSSSNWSVLIKLAYGLQCDSGTVLWPIRSQNLAANLADSRIWVGKGVVPCFHFRHHLYGNLTMSIKRYFQPLLHSLPIRWTLTNIYFFLLTRDHRVMVPSHHLRVVRLRNVTLWNGETSFWPGSFTVFQPLRDAKTSGRQKSRVIVLTTNYLYNQVPISFAKAV